MLSLFFLTPPETGFHNVTMAKLDITVKVTEKLHIIMNISKKVILLLNADITTTIGNGQMVSVTTFFASIDIISVDMAMLSTDFSPN